MVVGTSRDARTPGASFFDEALSLVRYNVNGTLDTSFGDGGKVLFTTLGSGGHAIAILPDGKILAAGYAILDGINSVFLLAKFNSNGTLDTSFSGNGFTVADFSSTTGAFERARAMAVQTDGKIVLVGENNNSSAALARFDSTGTLDGSFHGDGKVTGALSVANAVGIFGGKIVVAGQLGNSAAVARFSATGDPDTGFDGDGVAVNTSAQIAYSFAFLSITAGDDKIIVTGKDAGTGGPFSTGPSIVLWSLNQVDGSPDTTFGTGSGGHVDTNIAGSGNSVRIQFSTGVPNRIVVGGTRTDDFVVLRFTLSGTPDTAFGNNGSATSELGNLDSGNAMLIQPDNRIVLAGTTYQATIVDTTIIYSEGDFGVARFNTGGTLDTNFDGDGKRVDDVGNVPTGAVAVASQTDGKIIIMGTHSVVRLKADGTLDPSFDVDGKSKVPFGFMQDGLLQPDGKIVVAGSALEPALPGYNFVYRFNTDGSLDTAFGNGGMAAIRIGDGDAYVRAVTLQPDGKIVVAGDANTGPATGFDFAAARFLANGSPDTDFGTGGKVTTSVSSGDEIGYDVVIQPDGKIVVVGATGADNQRDMALVRYTPGGIPDTSFNSTGRQVTSIGPGSDWIEAVTMQAGKILVAGRTARDGGMGFSSDFALARYNLNGSLDSSFDDDGIVITRVGTTSDGAHALALQPDGKILAAGYTVMPSGLYDFALVRYDPNGEVDGDFGSEGKVTVDLVGELYDEVYDVALDHLGRVVLAGESGGLFGVARTLGDPFVKITSITRRASDGHIILEGLALPGVSNSLRHATTLDSPPFSFLLFVAPQADGKWQEDLGTPSAPHFYKLTSP